MDMSYIQRVRVMNLWDGHVSLSSVERKYPVCATPLHLCVCVCVCVCVCE